MLAVTLVSIGTGVAVAHAKADGAADLAALAGAGRLSAGTSLEGACARAERVAARNDAIVTGCAGEGRTLLVTVAVEAVVVGMRVRVPSVARAGPVVP